jgi:hypothetical protein
MSALEALAYGWAAFLIALGLALLAVAVGRFQ